MSNSVDTLEQTVAESLPEAPVEEEQPIPTIQEQSSGEGTTIYRFLLIDI
jgi:hypothetical protein